MSRETFWCIMITAGGGAALIFAVKVSKNSRKKFFKKICFRLEKHSQVVSA